MKRALIVFVIFGLVAAGTAAPAGAKKKKKKKSPPAPTVTLTPTELKFFLHWDSDGATPEGCTGLVHMNLEDAEGDTTCSSTAQVAQEALAATGQELVSYTFPASSGVPLILDSSRPVTGELTLRGTFTAGAYAELVLAGTVGGQQQTIAEGETTSGNGALSNTAQGVDLPGPPATVTFELPVASALDKLEATTLSLTVTIRGLHRGGIDYERTPSFLVVPALAAG